ncbi:MAG: YcjX family protein [Pseudomonadota bacterium]
MRLSDLADGVARTVEGVGGAFQEALFEPTVRLGVTGLSRAGKTVFITGLVANLLARGKMDALSAQAEGRIAAAFLQPQPDDTLPRFDYEAHYGALTAAAPFWPESTRSVSELRLSLRLQPGGLIGTLKGPRRLHLDIVDYPGEWLLDLGLLSLRYGEWSEKVLADIDARAEGAEFRATLATINPTAPLDEVHAKDLATAFTTYLNAAREAGYYNLTPGRFLLPGDLAGAPVLTFAPLPKAASPRGSLAREMERRFEAYKSQVAVPFFRDHLSRIDRQVVLADTLGALARGPRATADLVAAMSGILAAFKPGRNAFLKQLFLGRRVERILFAATKADRLHSSQHGAMTEIMEVLLKDARDRADFAGARTAAMAISALRATTEETRTENGRKLDMVIGRVPGREKPVAAFPGALPASGSEVLAATRGGAENWPDGTLQVLQFVPQPLSLGRDDGPPHIRLDRATEFLIGDLL